MSSTSEAGEIVSSDVVAGSESGPRSGRAKRRTFSTEFKRRIVAEYDDAPTGQKGAVLRRERLYDSHVQEWRAAIEAGTLEKSSAGRSTARRGSKPAKSEQQVEIDRLTRELAAERAGHARTREELAGKDAALDVLGKGVAFLEALSSKNA